MENLYAHTAATSPLPAYVSLNRQDDGRITLSVRSQGQDYASEIELSEMQLRSLMDAIKFEALGMAGAGG